MSIIKKNLDVNYQKNLDFCHHFTAITPNTIASFPTTSRMPPMHYCDAVTPNLAFLQVAGPRSVLPYIKICLQTCASL